MLASLEKYWKDRHHQVIIILITMEAKNMTKKV